MFASRDLVTAPLGQGSSGASSLRIARQRYLNGSSAKAGGHRKGSVRLREPAAFNYRARIDMPHKLGDVVIRRLVHNVLCRAGLDDAAAFENRNPVAELQGLVA